MSQLFFLNIFVEPNMTKKSKPKARTKPNYDHLK